MLTFGEKENGKTYITRLAVYGVMFNSNKDKIAVIQVRNKNHFLPSGGFNTVKHMKNDWKEKCWKRQE
ncbi:hypothetical protein [Jeotgalibacillus salarius]|uniref:Uncharacterized protein n=1 Tax=Jeotgalibacillus salarius TaxID=546023 RepID=A0A4Y8LE96_9BACL|nr:hypothetical protein [Jeotgalibacillus salarius]TFE00646.1 hypothetical protein E2626_11780 [Jeotgalibacillus salarius]